MSRPDHIPPYAERRPDAGFTLLEMMVALVLVALIGLLALPLARGGGSALAIDAAARDLATAIKAAQSDAVKEGTERSVLIDVDLRAWRREHLKAWTALPPGVGIDVTVPATDVMPGKVSRLRFFPDGSASGGTIVLRDRERRMTIAIDWLSGRITTSNGG